MEMTTTATSAHRSRPRDDRGAVLVIVAMFLPVALIMAAFVVDLGAQRAERIQTATAADAAALAAAAVIDRSDPAATGADRPCALLRSTDPSYPTVQSVADALWRANGGTGSPSCTATFTDTGAHVTVAGIRTVDYAFAGIVGQHSGTVAASSSASVASDAPDGPLMPLAICGTPTRLGLTGGVPEQHVFRYVPCGITNTPRHRQVNYGGNGGNVCTKVGRWCRDFLAGGYPGSVPARVQLADERWSPVQPALAALVADRTHFWVVAGTPVAPGNTAMDLGHWVEVQMLSYASKTYIEHRVHQVAPWSPAGPPPLSTASSEPVRLCATTADTAGCTAGTTNGDEQ